MEVTCVQGKDTALTGFSWKILGFHVEYISHAKGYRYLTRKGKVQSSSLL